VASAVKPISFRTFELLSVHLNMRGLTREYTEFKVFHTRQFRDTNNPQLIEELLRRKIAFLLYSKYRGDLLRLVAGTNAQQLASPFYDRVRGRRVLVRMFRVVARFRASPFEAIKHYCKLEGIDFPYTRSCFIGRPATRRRR